MKHLVRAVLAAVLLVGGTTSAVLAQGLTGQISGTVTDSSGGVLPGVTVTIKNDGAAKAGDFAVRLTVDGDDGQAKEKQVGALEAGQEREVRFDDVRLKQGERKLTAIVDAEAAISESDENNNERTVTARCKDAD